MISNQSHNRTPQIMGKSIGSWLLLVLRHYSHFTCRSSSHMVLDESNYDMHPDIFSTIVIPDFGLLFSGKPDGIQECVTYNPPGPTKPGGFKKVYIYL